MSDGTEIGIESRAQQIAGESSAEVAAEGLIEPGNETGGELPGPPPPPPDLTAAAFFDVDNTLVHGSSLVHFARGLAAREYFTYKDLARFAMAQAKFQLTGRENSDDVAAGRRKALAFIEGRSTAELVALGEEIYDEIIDVSFPDSIEVARALGTKEGILGGISSGAIVWAALELAKRPENAGKLIVAVVCDFGERYISTPLFEHIRD